MQLLYKSHLTPASLILDVEDAYAKYSRVRGLHPRPIGQLEFYVVARKTNGIRKDLVKPLQLKVKKNPNGYFLFFGAVEFSQHDFRQGVLEPDNYVIRVRSPLHFYQDAEIDDVSIPPKPDDEPSVQIDLLPGFAYPFPTASTLTQGKGITMLRGSLHFTDGRGIGGAVVNATGAIESYTTDETGQWVLIFSDEQESGPVTVDIQYPNGDSKTVPNVQVDQGLNRSLLSTAFRGWVLNEAGIGIPDAIIEVYGLPEHSTTDMNGSWFYYFDVSQPEAEVTVTARLPDGLSLAAQQLIKPKATVLVPTFHFD